MKRQRLRRSNFKRNCVSRVSLPVAKVPPPSNQPPTPRKDSILRLLPLLYQTLMSRQHVPTQLPKPQPLIPLLPPLQLRLKRSGLQLQTLTQQAQSSRPKAGVKCPMFPQMVVSGPENGQRGVMTHCLRKRRMRNGESSPVYPWIAWTEAGH